MAEVNFLFCLILLILLIKIFLIKNKYNLQNNYFRNVLSHDFRVAILAQLRGSELLQKQPWTSEENLILDNMNSSCKYTLEMISTLLMELEFENNQQTLYYELFNFTDLITSLANKASGELYEKNLKFKMNFTKQIFLEGDKFVLSKLISILLEVIISNSNKSECINFNIQTNGKMLSLLITYKGKPLTEEERNRMFSKNPHFSTVGYGTKMYLCKRIIDFHSGKIDVKDNKNGAISFKIILPLMKKCYKYSLISISKSLFSQIKNLHFVNNFNNF